MQQNPLLDEYRIVNNRTQGNREVSLLEMMKKLQDKRLLPPFFQREFVWKKLQICGWIESILENQAIGVIVTYQIDSPGSPEFLADGLQRLTATKLFVEDPSAYGYSFTKEDARDFCDKFTITVQHRIYKSHEEAIKAFQRLNAGTGLLRGDFFKGELALTEQGREISDKIPDLLMGIEKSLCDTRRMKSKVQQPATYDYFRRDAFASFLQYTIEWKNTYLWDLGKKGTEVQGVNLERELSGFVKGWTMPKLKKEMDDFENFVRDYTATLDKLGEEIGKGKMTFSRYLYRWLLHLNIWRKNNNRPFNLYLNFCTEILKLTKYQNNFQSVMYLPTQNSTERPYEKFVIPKDGLGRLSYLCTTLNVPLYEKQRRAKKPTRPGYHNSHVKPFSMFGEGETFLEPASINISRGAKEVLREED